MIATNEWRQSTLDLGEQLLTHGRCLPKTSSGASQLKCNIVTCPLCMLFISNVLLIMARHSLYCCPLTCNTLPLPARHLHPCIGPGNINVKSLTRCIGTFTFEVSRGDGRIPKNGNFHIGVIGSVPFHRVDFCHGLGFAGDLPVGGGIHELVSQQWSEQVRIV